MRITYLSCNENLLDARKISEENYKVSFFELLIFAWRKIKYTLTMNSSGYLMKLMSCKILSSAWRGCVDHRWPVFNILQHSHYHLNRKLNEIQSDESINNSHLAHLMLGFYLLHVHNIPPYKRVKVKSQSMMGKFFFFCSK